MTETCDERGIEAADSPDEPASQCAEPLWLLAWALTGDQVRAEQVVRDALLMVAGRRRPERGFSSWLTWLTHIVMERTSGRRGAWATVRRLISWRGCSDASRSDREAVAGDGAINRSAEPLAKVQAMIQRLPLEHRKVIVLRELMGMTYAQMAEAMGVAEESVAGHLAAARHELLEMAGGQLESVAVEIRPIAAGGRREPSERVGGGAMAAHR